LGLEVIAEGFETQKQLDFIKAHACNAYQGYLIGKPMAIECCELMLDQKAMSEVRKYSA